MPVVGASTAIITIRAVDMTTSVMNNMSRGFSANAARLQSQIVANNAAITRSAQNTARANELIQSQAARRIATLSREQVSIPKQISAEQLRVTQFAASEARRAAALRLQDAAAQQAAAKKLLQLEAQRVDLTKRIGQRGIQLLPQRNYVDQTIIATRAAEAARAQANLAARQAIAQGVNAEATAGMREVNALKQRGIALTSEMASAEQGAISAVNANNAAHANLATRLREDIALKGQQLKAQLNLAAAARVAETGRNIGRVGAQIGLGLTAVTTLPMLMAIGASTTAAIDFNKEMLNIQSIGKQTDDTIQVLGDSFLKLSADITKTTATPTDLANAFYEIQSSGFYGADAEKVLAESTKAATAGLADTKSTAMAAARSLNAYGDSANNVGKYLDIMVRGVDIGVYRMQDFNDQMGDFIAAAGMLGVPFEEVTAALTTMTKKGLGLDEAATSLNRIMMEYLKPSDSSKAVAAEFGIELNAAAIKANGFAAALQEVYDKTGGSEDALAGIFREMRAARGIFAIAGDGLRTYNEDLAKLRTASGSVDQIFAVQMKSWSAQVQSFKNSLSVLAISIGSEVLPVLTRMIQTDLKPFFANIASVAPGIFKSFVEGFSGFASALSTISPEQMRATGELFGTLAKVGPALMLGGIAVQGLSAMLGVLVKIADVLNTFPAITKILGTGAKLAPLYLPLGEIAPTLAPAAPGILAVAVPIAALGATMLATIKMADNLRAALDNVAKAEAGLATAKLSNDAGQIVAAQSKLTAALATQVSESRFAEFMGFSITEPKNLGVELEKLRQKLITLGETTTATTVLASLGGALNNIETQLTDFGVRLRGFTFADFIATVEGFRDWANNFKIDWNNLIPDTAATRQAAAAYRDFRANTQDLQGAQLQTQMAGMVPVFESTETALYRLANAGRGVPDSFYAITNAAGYGAAGLTQYALRLQTSATITDQALMAIASAGRGVPDAMAASAQRTSDLALAAGALMATGRGVPDMLERIGKAGEDAAKGLDKAAKAMLGMSVPELQFQTGKWTTNEYGEPELIPFDAAALKTATDDFRTWLNELTGSRSEKFATDQQTLANTRLTAATNQLRGIFEGLFSSAASASKALSDLTGTGGLNTKPGENGPFEDIYRLQAWIKDNSWGDVAAKAGITSKEQAKEIVGAFQEGNWLPALQAGLIDISKLSKIATDQMQSQANIDATIAKLVAGGLSQQQATALVQKQTGTPALPGQANLPGTAAGLTVPGTTSVATQNIIVTVGPGAVIVQSDNPENLGKLVGDKISKALQSMSTAVERQDMAPPWAVPGNP